MSTSCRSATAACCAAVFLCFLAGVAPIRASAQTATDTARSRWSALTVVGGFREERERLSYLLGAGPGDGLLLRSPSSRIPDRGGRWDAALLLPEARLHYNSAIPYSQNDGALWAGKGANLQVMVGARARLGPVSLVLAPQLAHSPNEDFALLPDSTSRPSPARSDYVAPWFATGLGIDLPLRFGDARFTVVDLGQSSLTLDAGPLALGAATENLWWGPGVRNALVMSNNAAGIPHVFVRTRRPLRTRIGTLEGRWIAGGLTESLYFDTITANSVRSLSALAFAFRPALAPGLAVGAARAVYAAADGAGDALADAANVLVNWEHRDTPVALYWEPRTQQVLSLFGHWAFPRSGFALYTEWARYELPVSVRDLLVDPNHTQAYTLGMEWGRAHRTGATRLRAESTFLEHSPTFRHRPFDPYYTSRTVPQGYTQRGQVVGAAIGPGSSSLWTALDHSRGRFDFGASLTRVRWQAGELQRSISPNRYRVFRSFHAWDASLIGALSAGARVGRMRVAAEYAFEQRYNFLFQNPDTGYGPEGAVDVRNGQLRLTITPF